MESKLLAGNIVDRSDEAKRALELKRQEVIEQKVPTATPAVLACYWLCDMCSVDRGRFSRSSIARRRVLWRLRAPSALFRRRLTRRLRS